MKKLRKCIIILMALSTLMIGNTVYADEEYKEDYYNYEYAEDEEYGENYYNEYTEDEEYEENYYDEYTEDEEYEENYYDEYIENEEDEEYYEEENSEYIEYEESEETLYEEESEYEEYSEYYEETVSEVSIEESSEPIIKNDPLGWQKNINIMIPADTSGYISPAEKAEKQNSNQSETHSTESTSPLPSKETVLNIVELVKHEDNKSSFVPGIVIWILIGFVTGLLFILFVNTKSTDNLNRRRYYKSAKHITKKHIK